MNMVSNKNLVRGFTLIELLVSISILVIIVAMSFVLLNSYNKNQELQNTAELILTQLKLAQQNTVTEQQKYGLFFNLETNQYSLIKIGNPNTTVNSWSLPTNIIFYQINSLPNNQVIFNSAGAVEYSGDLIIKQTQTNNQIKINIKPSGYVNWQTL